MSIPNYEKFMNPVLQAFAEQKEPKRKSSVAERIYDIIGLSKKGKGNINTNKNGTFGEFKIVLGYVLSLSSWITCKRI